MISSTQLWRVAAASLLLASAGWAQLTQRVSLSSAGAQANYNSAPFQISADGRYVLFGSGGNNLVPGDTNGGNDVFLRDRRSGTTERVSVGSGRSEGNYDSGTASMSGDGRWVAFESSANNLVRGDSNNVTDVFVHDRQSERTERVSVDSGEAPGDGSSGEPSISPDGRFVAFSSSATGLVPGDTNGKNDVFVRDRQSGTTERISIDSSGAQGNEGSYRPAISGDGRYVAFFSYASNLAPGDTNGGYDVFVRDRQSGTTERVSVNSGGTQGDGWSRGPSISADGRYVAFWSAATNLVPGDTNNSVDVCVRDRQSGTTERVSVDSNGAQGNSDSDSASISADGRYVAIGSTASNLVPGDTNGSNDIFVRDRVNGTTECVSVDSSGMQSNDYSFVPTISADGRYAGFVCFGTNLVPGDTNGFGDAFVRDRRGGPNFTSLCDPGFGGVIACPCANPPSGSGRGCDNSASTGGAILSASGGTFLSSDTLVLATSGETPAGLSIVIQGTVRIAGGLVYGQGVRCVGGPLERLYVKTASGGGITAPDFGAGDPSVSARSAALGNAILAGESRWYTVYYRDPIVLGGCPTSSTFNATQTGRVTWSP